MGSVVQLRRPAAEEQDSPSISDASLVEGALAGDSWAENALVRRYLRRIVKLVTYLIGDPQEVDDIVQESFLIAFRDLNKLRDPSSFRSWLTRIAVRRSRRVIRRQGMLRALGLDLRSGEESLESLAAPNLSAELRADLAVVNDVLRRCSANLRIAWLLRHVAGASIPEVASACGCSESTAKRRVRAAQARLAELVEVDDDA